MVDIDAGSQGLRPWATELKITMAVLLGGIAIALVSFGGTRRFAIWRPVMVLPIAIAVFGLNLGYYIEHQGRVDTDASIAVMVLALLLIVLTGRDFYMNIGEIRSKMGTRKPRKSRIPEVARVGFSTTADNSPAPHIAPHFLMLGYELASQSVNEWVFERGSRTGHMGIDLRRCFTQLTVRIGKRADGGHWVSCGWAVVAYVAASESRKLEAEGQSLARTMGVDTVTLTNSQSQASTIGTQQALFSVMGGSSKTGVWTPPSVLSVFSLLGGCEVDFRQAQLRDGETYRVFAASLMAGCDIIVPPHVRVEVTGVGLLGGFGHKGGDTPTSLSVTAPRSASVESAYWEPSTSRQRTESTWESFAFSFWQAAISRGVLRRRPLCCLPQAHSIHG